jgi:hypothetical protein
MTFTEKKKDNPYGFDAEPDNELYSGWTNYETWNVALSLAWDEKLYKAVDAFVNMEYSAEAALALVQGFLREGYGVDELRAEHNRYANFITIMQISSSLNNFDWEHTGDGVSWTDEKLNHAELNAMLKEMASDDFEREEYNGVTFNSLDKTPVHSRDWRRVYKDTPLYIPEEEK